MKDIFKENVKLVSSTRKNSYGYVCTVERFVKKPFRKWQKTWTINRHYNTDRDWMLEFAYNKRGVCKIRRIEN